VQPIGGVNEKIEGFFDICSARGLTGDQGVIIPHGNLPNLMLGQQTLAAVRANKFHVWAIHTVDQGLEILTGLRAGKPASDGRYPRGTVNRLVADRLAEMARTLREYS
jgi:predicted ATP-dependent protease